MTSKKKLPLAFWIFIGLAVGVVAGLILMNVPDGAGIDVAKNYIKPWGDIFLNLLKFVVVPIVLFSIASGVISMKDISKVGAIGGKTVVYYMCTTGLCRGAGSDPGQYSHWYGPVPCAGYHRPQLHPSRGTEHYDRDRQHLPLQCD